MKKQLIYFILGLVIVLEAGGMYYFYNKSKQDSDTQKELKAVKEERDSYISDYLIKTIEDNKLALLENIDGEKGAQEKLNLVYKILIDSSNNEEQMSSETINKKLIDIFGESLKVEPQDIKCPVTNQVYAKYDKDKKTYQRIDAECSPLKLPDEIEIMKTNVKNNTYEITLIKLYAPFTVCSSEAAFTSYSDIAENKNQLFTYDEVANFYKVKEYGKNTLEDSISYFKQNIEKLKEKAVQYKYTFKKNGTNFELQKVEKIEKES